MCQVSKLTHEGNYFFPGQEYDNGLKAFQNVSEVDLNPIMIVKNGTN
jgi:hypothetical protein